MYRPTKAPDETASESRRDSEKSTPKHPAYFSKSRLYYS